MDRFPEQIVLHSAGSVSVAILALILTILQAGFYVQSRRLDWYAWSAAISFSAFLYAAGIFGEYNTAPGPLNRASGLLEYTAILCLVHSLYGFTFSYLGMCAGRYHMVAGPCHGLLLILLWTTDGFVARRFVSRDFLGLPSAFVEPALGPLGPAFVLYAALAGAYAMTLWFRHREKGFQYRRAFLIGITAWLLLGIHDGLASMGLPTLLYGMEYGFLGFAMVVLWVVFNSYLEKTAEEKYRVITEFANDCILVIQEGETVFQNPACRGLMGPDAPEKGPRDFLDRMPSEDRRQVLKAYNTLLDTGETPEPFWVSVGREDGEVKTVEIACSRIEYRGKPAVLAIMRDMTDRKRKEEALRDSEEKLARLKKMESLGLLAGGVAHDLNNVLGGIIGYPDLLLMKLPEDSPLRKPIETMQASGKRAAAVVEDLLTVARGVAVQKAPVVLNDVVTDYLGSPEFQRLSRFHPAVEVKTRLDSRLFPVSGSSVHLRKAVMNLVSNAAEAVEGSGFVTITTRNRYLDRPVEGYETVKSGEYAVLSVSDTGPGIPPEDLERIFEPFYTKKVMGRSGTGLGLAVVWNIVHDHRGGVDVSTREDGTTFELFFPVTRDGIFREAADAAVQDQTAKGETVLVVDDLDTQRDLVTHMLQALGYRAVAVTSGEEAVARLKDHCVDLVLLDMIMDPGMDGLDTYRKILEGRPGQKALITSGFSETDRVREAQALGAGPYLKKPFTLEQLAVALRRELDRV